VKVSAIIPTYNTALYILRAVRSCLDISDIQEVIVIDDGSTDDSAEIIGNISDHRLTILRHPDGLNHGRSASRNLGMKGAKGDWIIFCDADDFCLQHRLAHLIKKDHTDIDGYYDLIEARTDDPALEDSDILQHRGIERKVLPADLFNHLASNRESWFNLTGLTIRKSSLQCVGLFDESLSIAEDTDLIWRLALNANLINGGATTPVAVRWVHCNNSYQDKTSLIKGRYAFYRKWKKLVPELTIAQEARRRTVDSYWYYRRKCLQHKILNWFGKK
jgi:glycosyltransferase involved in cell wall biosynthesis